MVMMPESTGWMLSLVCNSPVHRPARAPAPSAAGMESSGCPAAATMAATEAPNSIGKSRALEIALSHAGVSSDEAKRQRAELDREDGQPVYEVEFVTDGWEYEYVIHAATGVILQYEKDRED